MKHFRYQKKFDNLTPPLPPEPPPPHHHHQKKYLRRKNAPIITSTSTPFPSSQSQLRRSAIQYSSSEIQGQLAGAREV